MSDKEIEGKQPDDPRLPVFEKGRFPTPLPICDEKGSYHMWSPEIEERRDTRAGLQINEMQRTYVRRAIGDEIGKMELLAENAEILKSVRDAIGPSIDLSKFNDPRSEMDRLEGVLSQISHQEDSEREQKEGLITEDTHLWETRISEAFRTKCPRGLTAITWLLSKDGIGRALALRKMTKGIAQVRVAKQKLDRAYEHRSSLVGKEGTYRRDLNELSLAWEMLRGLYAESESDEGTYYRGTLRLCPSHMFESTRLKGGRALKSPQIYLEASYEGCEMAECLNDLDAEDAGIDTGDIKSTHFLDFNGGRLVFRDEEPYLSKEQRGKLLSLVRTEETTWSRDVDGREKVVSHPQHAQILASWRLMRTYIEFLVGRIEERERIMGETTRELPKLLEEASAEITRLERFIYGPNFIQSLTADSSGEQCYRLSPDMIKQFRAFMELLKETPLAKSIFDFAKSEGLRVDCHVRDGILEGFAYDYDWEYGSGYNEAQTAGFREEDKERFIDPRGRNLARKWHEGGDFVRWKDKGMYRREREDGSAYYSADGLRSDGDKINPKVFYGGTIFDRVALRLLDELARSDEHFQCPMFFGTREEGNALETDSLAEALARKMWEMEKKWGCMSDENRRLWLDKEWTKHMMPNGRTANVVQLASYDYHES